MLSSGTVGGIVTLHPLVQQEYTLKAIVRRFLFAPDRPLGLIHPIIAVLPAWVVDYRGFAHGFTIRLLIWWIWEDRPSAIS